MVRVLSTQECDAWEKLLDKAYHDEIQAIIHQLKQSLDVGKPLGYPFFREKKFGKYRVYFLIYEELDAVLLVTISDKKAQPDTIERIKADISKYLETIRSALQR